jgi:hypothetical protein
VASAVLPEITPANRSASGGHSHRRDAIGRTLDPNVNNAWRGIQQHHFVTVVLLRQSYSIMGI